MSSPHESGAHDLEGERDYWRTLMEVTNAVVTKRGLAELRTTISPNVRRVVPHDHTNLFLFDEQGQLGPFVIDPSAPPWPEHLATLIQPETEPYKSRVAPLDRTVEIDVENADPTAALRHAPEPAARRACR